MPTSFLAQARSAFDDVFFEIIFDENATFVDLLVLAGLLATFIFAIFGIFRPFLVRLIKGPLKETMWKIAEMEFNRLDKIEAQEIFQVTSKQEYLDLFIIGFWPETVLIMIQHLIGGCFAIPAVLGAGDFSQSTRSSLACLGILTEMGWEIQDLCRMYYCRLFMGKEGAKMYPIAVLAMMTIHHSLATLMGLPAILNYRDLPEMHRLIFDLQFAGGFMILLPEITRTLDVTKKNELRMFVFVSSLMFLLIAWTRVFDWFYLVYKLMARFHADENWSFLVLGGFVFSLFSVFNLFFCVIPTYQRFTKFMQKLYAFESLPKDAGESKRRATIIDLQVAAAEFSAIETRIDEAILEIFSDRKVERRHTFNSATLSRSVALAGASMGSSSRKIHPHRQSMVAWRGMPSMVKQRAENKTD